MPFYEAFLPIYIIIRKVGSHQVVEYCFLITEHSQTVLTVKFFCTKVQLDYYYGLKTLHVNDHSYINFILLEFPYSKAIATYILDSEGITVKYHKINFHVLNVQIYILLVGSYFHDIS